VLSNLLANALAHGEAEAPVSVDIDGSEQDWLRLRIHNRGAMPENMVAQAFMPFRPGREGRGQPGLGLGLFIVKYFIDAHRGSITLASNVADGTTFTIRLPRRTDGDAAA
jgi:signal transduction histidine kinase